MPIHDLLLLHASRAGVDPVAGFYLNEAPDLRPVNILDEGVMGYLRTGDYGLAISRISALIQGAVIEYGIRGVLLTCSALSPIHMKELRRTSPIPILKIDEPMLAAASGKIGLLASFPATVETTLAWLDHFHPGRKVEVLCAAAALDALLKGDQETHDREICAAADQLAARGIDTLVLAQVSMARMAETLSRRTGVKTVESLTYSLPGVRGMIS